MAAGYSNDDVVVVVTGGSGGESGLLASRFAVTAAASSYVFRKRRTNVLDGWMDGWMEDELIGGGHGEAQVCPSVRLRA